MAHSSHPQEMADAVAWLKQRLPQALPSEAELRAMGNADLKRLAASRFAASATHALCSRRHPLLCRSLTFRRGISTAGFAEKEDFVRALLESAKL